MRVVMMAFAAARRSGQQNLRGTLPTRNYRNDKQKSESEKSVCNKCGLEEKFEEPKSSNKSVEDRCKCLKKQETQT